MAALLLFVVPSPLLLQHSLPIDPYGGQGVQHRPPLAVAGQVVDGDSIQPIPHARVVLEGDADAGIVRRRVIADEQGRFVFTGIPVTGPFQLLASADGYVGDTFSRPGATLRASDGPAILHSVRIALRKLATIEGRVTDEHDEPIVGIRVRAFLYESVAGVDRLVLAAAARTDDRGVYTVDGLRPGRYVVGFTPTQRSLPVAELRAYAGESTQEIPRGSEQAQLPARAGPVTGAAYWSRPEGLVVGRSLLLVTEDARHDVLAPVVDDTTGDVFVYPSVFYPAQREATTASAISLSPGQTRSGVDLRAQMVPGRRVSGRITRDAQAASRVPLCLAPADPAARLLGFRRTLHPGACAALTLSGRDGEFEFPGVPSGLYELHLEFAAPFRFGPETIGLRASVVDGILDVMLRGADGADQRPEPPSDRVLWARMSVSVGASDVTGLSVSVEEGYRVSGRVRLDGQQAVPSAKELEAILLAVEPRDGVGLGTGVEVGGYVDARGTFETRTVPPGEYLIRVARSPAGWSVDTVLINGVNALIEPVRIAGDVTDALIVLTDQGTEIEGRVRSSTARLDERRQRARVVVFPQERRLWVNHGARPPFMRMTVADPDGQYAIRGLPPGNYFVAAVPDGGADFAFVPEALLVAERQAVRVSLKRGEPVRADLTLDQIGRRVSALTGERWLSAGPMPALRVVSHARLLDEGVASPPLLPPPAAAAGPQPAAAAPGVLRGRVVDPRGAGSAVRSALVRIVGERLAFDRRVSTNAEGAFEFHELPSGHYSVSVTKAAYVMTNPPSALARVLPGAVTEVQLGMARGAVIAGRVVKDDGTGFAHASVTVVSREDGGLVEVQNARADSAGRFRLYGLSEGDYAVLAGPAGGEENAWDTDGGSVGRANMYYPGVRDIGQAEWFRLLPGSEVGPLEIRLPLERVYRVGGQVTGREGSPLPGASVLLRPVSPDHRQPPIGERFVRTDEKGQFVFEGVPDGSYAVSVRIDGPRRRAGADRGRWAEQPLVVDGAEATRLTITLGHGSDVRGVVQVEPFDNPSVRPPFLVLQILNIGRVGTAPALVEVARVGADRIFAFSDLLPGRYAVLSVDQAGRDVPPADRWTMTAASAEGIPLAGGVIEVTGASGIRDLVVRMARGSTSLKGQVPVVVHEAPPDLAVIVFPADRSMWHTEPLRVRGPVRPAQDGRFAIDGLPPGEYCVSPVVERDLGAWRRSSLLETFARRGSGVELKPGEETQVLWSGAGCDVKPGDAGMSTRTRGSRP